MYVFVRACAHASVASTNYKAIHKGANSSGRSRQPVARAVTPTIGARGHANARNPRGLNNGLGCSKFQRRAAPPNEDPPAPKLRRIHRCSRLTMFSSKAGCAATSVRGRLFFCGRPRQPANEASASSCGWKGASSTEGGMENQATKKATVAPA